jgi:hypothetical protein
VATAGITTAIRAPTKSLDNHQVVLTQLKETTEVAQRLRGQPGDSFVKLSELINAGIVNYIGGVVSANKIKAGAAGTGNTAKSIQGDGSPANPIELVNDATSPGANTFYGTNGAGVKGFYPTSGGGTVTSVGFTSSTLTVTGSPITTNGTINAEITHPYGPLTTKGDLYGFSTVGARVPVGANGKVLTADSTAATGVSWQTPSGGGGGAVTLSDIEIVRGGTFTGGTTVMTSAPDIPLIIPQGCTIAKVVLLTEGGTGSCQVDIFKAPFGGTYPPTASITASAKPTISAGTTYSDAVLTGWTTAINANDVLLLRLLSTSGFTSVSVVLYLSVPAALKPTSKGAAWSSSSGPVVAAGSVQIPITIPADCTLIGVDMLSAGGPGTCSFSIWKAPAGTFPPVIAGDITGGAPVGITAAKANSITSLSGWTTSFSAGDVILFTLNSCSTFTLVTISLRMQ